MDRQDRSQSRRGHRRYAGDAGLSQSSIEQETQHLTWNIADQEALFKEEFY